MRLKRYTARDIDTMRKACLDLIQIPRLTLSTADQRAADDEQAERTLRTYMDNGTTARELVAEVERVEAETLPRREQQRDRLMRELDHRDSLACWE